MIPAVTPDGRYIVVDGRLWRSSNPRLPEGVRQKLVNELMDARRAVRAALSADDPKAVTSARSRVQAAKEALGERGAVWWDDGAPDLNRRSIENTPYAQWWRGEGAVEASQGRTGRRIAKLHPTDRPVGPAKPPSNA